MAKRQEKPEWFELDNYFELRNLPPEGWSDNLWARFVLLDSSPFGIPSNRSIKEQEEKNISQFAILKKNQ